MIVYTTCRDCGGLLHTTDGDTVHPLCTPRPTHIELLEQAYLAAMLAGDELTADGVEYDMEQHDNRPPRLLDAALTYARWGWPVFPLKPESKQPATRNGFKNATTDTDQIRAWWTTTPDANIGLPTGQAFDVIDIDPPVGVMSHDRLLTEDLLPDVHGRVTTASGGVHYYIAASGDGNRAGILPGVDYRGLGGYVVAPPSRLDVRWRSWSWSVKPSPVLTGKSTHAKAAA